MFNNVMLMSLIADIQTDIEYLKKVVKKLQETTEELHELNEKLIKINKEENDSDDI